MKCRAGRCLESHVSAAPRSPFAPLIGLRWLGCHVRRLLMAVHLPPFATGAKVVLRQAAAYPRLADWVGCPLLAVQDAHLAPLRLQLPLRNNPPCYSPRSSPLLESQLPLESEKRYQAPRYHSQHHTSPSPISPRLPPASEQSLHCGRIISAAANVFAYIFWKPKTEFHRDPHPTGN